MCPILQRLVFCALPVLAAASVANSAPIQNPGNEHYYELVQAYVSWTDSKAGASARQYLGMQGYLATVSSQAENDWILANILPRGTYATGVWIGGAQDPAGSEPGGGWHWDVCTGEPFLYTNWEGPPEQSPDEAGGSGCENFMEIHLGTGKWGDAGNGPVPGGLTQTLGYIVEYGGSVSLPCPTNAVVCPPPPACSDGMDNDGDGCADYPGDLGCSSALDISEADGSCAACSDGLDNDGDGCADFPADPGCASRGDDSEAEAACPAACSDGLDNDGDGCPDYPSDLGCSSALDISEADGGCAACTDGLDNDGDGCVDYPADAGCSSANDDSEAGSGGGCELVDVPPGAPFAAEVLQTTPDWERTFLARRSNADTVWIGHVADPSWVPRMSDGVTPVPGVPPGGYGPYKVGRGPNRPTMSGNGNNGVWTFDHRQPGEADSLQGWWPVALPYVSAPFSVQPDRERPFFGLDYGNQGNYAINQGSPKRTFGVTGYWHRDPGNSLPPSALPGTSPAALQWSPLAGAASAWCGLRSHGDVTVIDPTTGNPFNQTVLDFNGNHWAEAGSRSETGTDRNFPGYGSQWDQMLYRDVVLFEGQGLDVSFLYRTNLSTGRITDTGRRIGWFDKDPLRPPTSGDGNFISSTDAGLNAPADSFMVYIGVPVEPVAGPNNDFMCSDPWAGANFDGLLEIHDLRRRWFSEVVAIDKPYRELLTLSGVTATQVANLNLPPNGIVQQILDADGTGNGGTVRLVFRVKTNRGFDDEDSFRSGFSSGTAGAAVVDAIVVNGWAASLGDFENPGDINNDPAVPATSAWKSTGKPPGANFHLHDLSSLIYDDPCGPVSSSSRLCNMQGMVLAPGDHDRAEKPGGFYGSNRQDGQMAVVSPTINLRSHGPGDFNAMGIDADVASAEREIVLWFDMVQDLYDYTTTGNGFRIGWQSYPATQPNGTPGWGEVRWTPFLSMTGGARGCHSGFGGYGAGVLARANHLIVTSNPSGVPDSLRCYLQTATRCFSMPLNAAECSPNSGRRAAGYFDNLAIGFVGGIPPLGMSLSISSLFNDAFPANSVAPIDAAFDTTTATVKTGLNTAPRTRTLQRHDIPGDTTLVHAPGSDVRVDLVFRILPGPGNHVIIGNRGSGLRKVPTATTAAVANPFSNNFWESYLADNGGFGTGGDGSAGPGHPGGAWDPNRWNSARCDTAERNLFPAVGSSPDLPELARSYWASMYHEADPKFATLGIAKNRCFMIDPSPGREATCTLPSPCNVTCGPGTGPYPPAWAANPAAGLNPSENGLPLGQTSEFTKIIPDGQLTPGTSVQYFFRRSTITNPSAFELAPDTNRIFPQPAEGSFDAHRWQYFGVLPDRWKDVAYGGPGMACMLVVDLGDRRGDELSWVATADTIELTRPLRRGAHNGWRAGPSVNIAGPEVGGNDAVAVRPHLGQPGTQWDLYQVKAGESHEPAGRLGSRSASQVSAGLAAGKFSTLGPTGNMLRSFYRTLVVLGGDLGAGVLGPIPDQTDGDIGLLNDFMTSAAGTPVPRGVIMTGRDLVSGQYDGTRGNPTFFPTLFGTQLRDQDYRALSGNSDHEADLIPGPLINSFPYRVRNGCTITNDVFSLSGVVSGAQSAAEYGNAGFNGPYIASVFAPEGGGRIARTLVNGWTIGDQGFSGSTLGRHVFWHSALTGAFGSLLCGDLTPSPVAVGDAPPGVPDAIVSSWLGLRSGNPMRGRQARLALRLAATEEADLRIYDVSGRMVRSVAHRVFEGGKEHVVTWDGTSDTGETVRPGLYFYQVRTASYVGQKKLIVLN